MLFYKYLLILQFKNKDVLEKLKLLIIIGQDINLYQ